MTKVAIIGAGQVGATLGNRLLLRHPVTYGTRSARSAKIQDLLNAQHGAKADSIQDAVSWADVVILSVPGGHDDAAIRATAASLGPGIKGKVVLDACNPLSTYPALEVRHGQLKSGGEILAEALPEAHVFKAFNSISVELMAALDRVAEPVPLLYAGPTEGQGVAEAVIMDGGFEPVYVGPIRYARNLEAIAELVIHVGDAGYGVTPVDLGRLFHLRPVSTL